MKTINKIYAAAIASLFCMNMPADTSVSSTGEITGLYQEKFATPNSDGTYTLTIDSYSTGYMVTEQTTTCLNADVVLIIDMSTSMRFGSGTYTSWSNTQSKYELVESTQRDTSEYYCTKVSSNYYPVDHRGSSGWQYYNPSTKSWTNLGSNSTYRCGYSAVLTAAEKFLINLKKDAVMSASKYGVTVNHRVKILSFSNSTTSYNTHGDFCNVNTEYSKVITNLLSMKDFGMGTNPATAIAGANSMLTDPSSTGNTKSVVFFTDGAISSAEEVGKAIKNAHSGKEAKITYFSIGWSLPSTEWYMNCLDVISSNFPNADVTTPSSFNTSNDLGTTSTPKGLALAANRANDFYMRNTDDPMELTQYFEVVAASIAHAAKIYNLSTTTQIRDTVTSDFKLPDGFKSTDVNCYTIACNGFDSSGNPQFASTETPKTGLNISVNTTKNSVVVDGFDFKANVCTMSGSTPTGCKLRIKFIIEPTASFKGGYNIDTNKPGSGIYESGDVKADTIGTYPIPKVAAPVDLIVSETGLKAGESATFTITRSTDPTGASKDASFKHEVILTGPSDQETIKQVSVKVGDDNTAATYYYFVDSQLWDWRYTPNKTADKHILYDDTLPDPFTNTFPFSFSDKTGIQSSIEGRKNATM